MYTYICIYIYIYITYSSARFSLFVNNSIEHQNKPFLCNGINYACGTIPKIVITKLKMYITIHR